MNKNAHILIPILLILILLFCVARVVVTKGAITGVEIGTYVALALNADALWAIGLSPTSAPHGVTVAKRFLGPTGVAIALVSFGVCIAERLLID